jgi:tetratricopeptide (TPR) repeat protein
MALKFRSLAFMIFLIFLFSGVVYGQDVIDEGGKTIDGIFYGEGCKVGAKDNNLLIGGIGQVGDQALKPDVLVDLNPEYKEIANNNKAIYVPTYYTGSIAEDSLHVDLAATSKPTDMNGLESPALNDQQYGTIIAYSGGTASVIAAIYKQRVSCDTLILISPMRGVSVKQEEYDEIIKQILGDAVKHIIVIQAPNDQLILDSWYKAKFTEGEDPRIDVYDIDLETTGEQAHKDLFFVHAKENLMADNNGNVIYLPSQPSRYQESNAFKKPNLEEFSKESSTPIESCKTAEAEDWFNKGETSYDQKQYKEAIKYYTEAIKICQQYEEAWFGKGDAYLVGKFGFFNQNDPAEAILCYDEATKINPQHAKAWNNKGTAFHALGKNDDAIRCYNEAIRIDSQYADAMYGKGHTLYEMGNYAEALLYVNEAISLDPESSESWKSKGDILKALGSDEAQSAFDKSNELEILHKPTHEAKGAVSYD